MPVLLLSFSLSLSLLRSWKMQYLIFILSVLYARWWNTSCIHFSTSETHRIWLRLWCRTSVFTRQPLHELYILIPMSLSSMWSQHSTDNCLTVKSVLLRIWIHSRNMENFSERSSVQAHTKYVVLLSLHFFLCCLSLPWTLGYNPIHTYWGVSFIELNVPSFWVVRHRFVLSDLSLVAVRPPRYRNSVLFN